MGNGIERGIMPKDDESSIWFEVLQRLTKIETNTEGLNEISGIARSALTKSEENARDIEVMKENQKVDVAYYRWYRRDIHRLFHN